MTDEQAEKEEPRQERPAPYLSDRVAMGAMIALNVIILQALIGFQKPDSYLHNAAIAVSVALPCLVAAVVLSDMPGLLFKSKEERLFVYTKIGSIIQGLLEVALFLAGIIATLIAVGNALYHVAPDAGAIFVKASIVLYLLVGLYGTVLVLRR